MSKKQTLADKLGANLSRASVERHQRETEAPPARESSRCLAGVQLPLKHIEPSATNPRKNFDEAKLAELAESIKARGVLQPIVVRPLYQTFNGVSIEKESFWLKAGDAGPSMFPPLENCRFELVAGERRWRAAEKAGLATIPATVLDLTDKEAREIQVIENEQRDDLSPLEKAAGYRDLVKDHGYSVEDLATKVGKSPATIYGLLKLLELPEKAKKAVAAGELAMSAAQLIARVPDAKARTALVNDAYNPHFKEWGSYREIKRTIQHRFMVELKQAPFSQKDERLVPAAGSCEACPKRTGNDRANYPDARADVCTDPGCYRGKLEAHAERLKAVAKEKGQTVLAGKAAEEALRSYPAPPYVKLDDQADQPMVDWDSKAYGKRFRQLLSAELKGELKDKIVLAIDAKGRIHELVRKSDLSPIIKKKFPRRARAGGDSYARQQREQQQKAKLRKQAGALAMAKIAEQITSPTAYSREYPLLLKSWLTLMIENVAEMAGHDMRRAIIRRRGLGETLNKKDTFPETAALIRHARDLSTFDLYGLLAEVCFARELYESFSYGTGQSKKRDAIMKEFKLDWKALLKEAAAPAPKKPTVKQALPAEPWPKNGKASKSEDTLEQGLLRALHSFGEADERLAALRRNGADDVTLKKEIGELFGDGGSRGPEQTDISTKGGPNPRFWFGSMIHQGNPTLQGKALVAKVRELIGIPEPTATTKIEDLVVSDAPANTYAWEMTVRRHDEGEDKFVYVGSYAQAKRKALMTPRARKVEICQAMTKEQYKAWQQAAGESLQKARLAELVRREQPSNGKAAKPAPGACRVCGCTDDDCEQCVEKTGQACYWIEPGLCSACVLDGHAPETEEGRQLANVALRGREGRRFNKERETANA